MFKIQLNVYEMPRESVLVMLPIVPRVGDEVKISTTVWAVVTRVIMSPGVDVVTVFAVNPEKTHGFLTRSDLGGHSWAPMMASSRRGGTSSEIESGSDALLQVVDASQTSLPGFAPIKVTVTNPVP